MTVIPTHRNNIFLLEALKGLTCLAMIAKAMSAEGQIEGGVSGMRSRVGASVSSVDGHVSDWYTSIVP